MQRGQAIRIRIEEELFNPTGPKEPPKAVAAPAGDVKPPEETKVEGPAPYSLIVRRVTKQLQVDD